MIIIIGGEKGGTGKTTIATNLAALHVDKQNELLLIDTDKQGSASAWAATRDNVEDRPRVASIQKFGKGIINDVKELSRKYADIIIDAGGRDSIELRAAMTVADVLFIPIQASQFDVWTIGNMEEIVQQAQTFNEKLQTFIVFNRASTNPNVRELDEAREILSDFESLKISNTVLSDRIAYRKAAKAGLSVAELDNPDSKANNEVKNLYEEIFS
jgi:chromosome partitioning protein